MRQAWPIMAILPPGALLALTGLKRVRLFARDLLAENPDFPDGGAGCFGTSRDGTVVGAALFAIPSSIR